MWGYIWHNWTRHVQRIKLLSEERNLETHRCGTVTLKSAQGHDCISVSFLFCYIALAVLCQPSKEASLGHTQQGMWLCLHYFLPLRIHLNHLKIL